MIFEINVDKKDQFVLVKEIQYHPVTDEIIHIDFQKVKEDEKISLEVAVRSAGEAQGVKLGGILVQMLNNVTIKCKPTEIPEFVEIDVTDMEVNTNLFVKDISLPQDVEMITADDIAVVSIQEPKEEKEEVEDIAVADDAEETTEDTTSSSEDTEEKAQDSDDNQKESDSGDDNEGENA